MQHEVQQLQLAAYPVRSEAAKSFSQWLRVLSVRHPCYVVVVR